MKKLWNKLTGIDRLRARIAYLEKLNQNYHEGSCRMADLAYDRRTALRAIAACETPGANGTVKRMAKIARDALTLAPITVADGDGIEITTMDSKPKWIGAKI